MPTVTAIIVDDEPKARETLQTMLSQNCPEIEIVAQCANVQAARIALLEHNPQLVFLDIKMPGGSGFDLLPKLENRQFEIIFTTAFDEYAVQAFEHHAIGYLLKPILSSRLKETVDRVLQLKGQQSLPYQDILSDLKNRVKGKLLSLPVENGVELLPAEDLLRFQASGSYAMCYLVNGQKRLLSKSLKSIEQLVAGESFFRIHNSHLVNLKHVRKIVRTDGGFLVMSDGTELEISRRKKSELLNYLNA